MTNAHTNKLSVVGITAFVQQPEATEGKTQQSKQATVARTNREKLCTKQKIKSKQDLSGAPGRRVRNVVHWEQESTVSLRLSDTCCLFSLHLEKNSFYPEIYDDSDVKSYDRVTQNRHITVSNSAPIACN